MGRLLDEDDIKAMFTRLNDNNQLNINDLQSELDKIPTACDINNITSQLKNIDYTDYPSGRKVYLEDVMSIIQEYKKYVNTNDSSPLCEYLLNRKKELESLLKNETDKVIKQSLRIRWNEIGKALDELKYKEPEPSLNELLKDIE